MVGVALAHGLGALAALAARAAAPIIVQLRPLRALDDSAAQRISLRREGRLGLGGGIHLRLAVHLRRRDPVDWRRDLAVRLLRTVVVAGAVVVQLARAGRLWRELVAHAPRGALMRARVAAVALRRVPRGREPLADLGLPLSHTASARRLPGLRPMLRPSLRCNGHGAGRRVGGSWRGRAVALLAERLPAVGRRGHLPVGAVLFQGLPLRFGACHGQLEGQPLVPAIGRVAQLHDLDPRHLRLGVRVAPRPSYNQARGGAVVVVDDGVDAAVVGGHRT